MMELLTVRAVLRPVRRAIPLRPLAALLLTLLGVRPGRPLRRPVALFPLEVRRDSLVQRPVAL